ncbi:scarecrow-like protein 8 [Eucalyptus grandis]|uniref:scarecrow-like protein 8 n=1 Tax=Eucalyptus grandis TaxID=71139 RepID=UPI00192EF8DC|nr:scarecrow-like protein 8 [Eucalyptus grandis]
MTGTSPPAASARSRNSVAKNPKKLRDAFDAHFQTGHDPRQPLFAGDLIFSVLGSFSSNTQSLSSGTESYEGFQVPSNAFVSSEVSKGSESVMSPLESVKTPVQSFPVESFKTPVRTLQMSTAESVETPVQRSSVLCEQSLLEAATAIYEGRVDEASEILRRSSVVPQTMGNSKQKLMGYMLSALKSRVSPVDYPPPVAELFTEEHVSSVRSLYDLSPCFRLCFLAANKAILEAASEQPSTNKLHVIDFDIGWEGQYNNLLDDLSMRQEGNQFTLKITTLADSFYGEKWLRMLGDRLSLHAAQVKVMLVFNIVSQNLRELSRDLLGCEPDEVLAVNLAFKLNRMPDESVSTEITRDELLQRVKGLAPQVVTLVEHEMNGNTAPFPMRVEEALAYYGVLLASFNCLLPRDKSKRPRAEEGLSWRLGNSVACKGRDRVERCEVFGKWRARMGMAGFKLKPLGPHVAKSMQKCLHFHVLNSGFTAKEENGGVCFSWSGRTLTVVSAWR